MDNKTKISQLLNETAELLGNDSIESLEESIINFDDINMDALHEDASIGALVAMFAVYFGALIGLPIIIDRAERKRIAKESVAISAEEYNKAIDFLMSLHKQIEAIFKTSEYKKYIDKEIIDIAEDLPKIDLTDKKFNKDRAFSSWYRLFSVNIYKLSQETGKYDEIITTDERLKEYLKKESEKIAKIIDKCRQLCNKNDFIKKNFTVVGEWNKGKTIFTCLLFAKNSFVLNSSKYLKK